MKKLFKIAFVLILALLAWLFVTRASAEEGTSSTAVGESVHTVCFYDRSELLYETEVWTGDTVELPDAPARDGYKFVGWRKESMDGDAFEITSAITADLNLYAAYELLPPTFEVSSLSFTYDGEYRRVEFKNVSHPLLKDGFLSYEWYKNGESIDHYASSLSVCDVSDSGKYTCLITFSVVGDVASVLTPEIEIDISKCEISLPSIPSVSYSGDALYPEIFDTGAYSVERMPYTLAGTYPIKITLNDPDNYKFESSELPAVTVDFIINKADNFWVEPPSVRDVYTSAVPNPTALPRFGEVVFLFASASGGEFVSSVPTEAGQYLMKAEVAETENYTALSSEPILFTLLAETVAGIAVKTPADKMVYTAFEFFDPKGLTVGVTYNSGRYELLPIELLTFTYQQADSFRYRDSGVIISYSGTSVLLRIEVLRADYDLSGIVFSDASRPYDGTYVTHTYTGTLPVGLDGISLAATASGGGIDAGSYTVTLDFSTQSDNYNRPKSITAVLTVLPRMTEVVWSSLSFVYDGTPKLPEAYYLDIHGRKVILEPSGSRSFAGAYTAHVTSPDRNYSFTNPETEFQIAKANYDMSAVYWVGGGLTYNGEEHEVYLSNLPSGVSVIGYVNNKATDVGSYTAGAVFSYDTANYNTPEIPDYLWYIIPASYPVSGFSFLDNNPVYDGQPHYPIFEGKMPVGNDGIALEYSYTAFATNVTDGRVAVEIVFTTASKNYVPPTPIIRYVQVSALGITVVWENTEFRYTGAEFVPYAFAQECDISVTGAVADAGEYTAFATAQDPNYTVQNPTCDFTIIKAYNDWLVPLAATDVFFGRIPEPFAQSLAGDVTFTYYSDIDCTEQIDGFPTEVGIYYVIASSAGDNNHLPIISDPVSFEIVAIIPTDLRIFLDSAELIAFDTVAFTAELLNNDGSTTPVEPSAVAVVYPTADSLRFGDTSVAFTYGSFTVTAAVRVSRRDYDMSAVVWEHTECIYDGSPKSAVIKGLPEGVTVTEYIGNYVTEAGRYTVTAMLSYDSHNYNQPVSPETTLVINKQSVPLPAIAASEYNGSAVTPKLPISDLYTAVFGASPTAAGSYPVILTLRDPANYTFDGASSSATVYFVIAKRPIEVTVSDFDLYLFEDDITPTFTVTGGTLLDSDTLTPTYRIEDGRIYADFDNPDYDITVIPGKLNRRNTLSRDALSVLLLIIFSILALILLLIILLTNRRRIYRACRAYAARAANEARYTPPPASDVIADDPGIEDSAEELIAEEPDESEELDMTDEFIPPDPADVAAMVDAEYADTVITNSLAKDLIRRDEDVVTNGNKKGIINVDTLSRSFSAGDRVDVNALKNKSLIPYDTAYIKVLARGMIDKPLYVYANDFSLAAVKMIALTGGKAIKVNTVHRNDKFGKTT